MPPTYDVLLVIMSVAIAVLASYVALDLTGRLSRSRGRVRTFWWLGGAVAMGVGIWSMHFVGMLALKLPVQMEYDVPLVLLSVVVAIAASALALHVASSPVLPTAVLVASSVLMGAAISGMHYIGMAAMIVPVQVTWSPELVVASIGIAVGASFAALTLAFQLRREEVRLFRWMNLGAAGLMGLAIVGMHYTGMAAARFGPAVQAHSGSGPLLHSHGLSVAVIAGTLLILGLALASAAIDERERLLEREQRVRQEVETANRLKDEFLATLSHELRTPLNVILGRTQMLLALDAPDERVRQLGSVIQRNADSLAALVEDLLDVSRITFGQVRLDMQPLVLSELLHAAVQGIQPAAQAKNITLTCVVVTDGVVNGDQTRLQQIVSNLLTNAIKYTPAHGFVQARLSRRGSQMALMVTDSGRGIEADFLPHVFDAFRQGEPTATRTHGGLGIGLALVRRLVELHGGSAAAQSPGTDRGSTFTVLLPAHADGAPATVAARSRA